MWKTLATTTPECLLLGTGLIWSNLTWNKSGKMDRLKNKCVSVSLEHQDLIRCDLTHKARIFAPYFCFTSTELNIFLQQ